MSFDNVNVNVSGGQSIIKALQNYNTIILKPNIIDNRNVLTQEMISEKHTKYVIKWNYSLEDEIINIPKDCIIEFAGGTIDNGTIVGNNTILIYNKPIDEVCPAERQGTFIYNTTVADEEDITSESGQLKFKDRPVTYGMGKKILRKNIVNGVNTLTQSMINQPNTIYVIQYDFTLEEDITIPKNCVLKFDGGSISGYRVSSSGNTIICGYGFNSIIDNVTSKKFIFEQPTWVNPNASEINANGSRQNPYKSLKEAEKHTNWIALFENSIYTPGCDSDFSNILELHHDLVLECPNGIATISGLVTINGTSSVENNINTVTISGVTDKNGNLLSYSSDNKSSFDFGYIHEGYKRNYRVRTTSINSITSNTWSDIASKETEYSLPIIKIGEASWYSKYGSIGTHCFTTHNYNFTLRNISVQDFGKHGIAAGNGSKISILNCSFINIGGSYVNILSQTPYGNAVQIFSTDTKPCYIKAQGCSFINIFDAGITIQGPGRSFKTFEISECTFNGCTYGIEYFESTDNMSSVHNNDMIGYARNNIFINCKRQGTRWDKKGLSVGGQEQENQCAIQLWNNSEQNFEVYQNILIDSTLYSSREGNSLPQTRDNKLFYSYQNPVIIAPYHYSWPIILKVDGINTKDALSILQKSINNRGNSILVCPSNNSKGNSLSRPSADNVYIGFQYFDITLNKPIYVSNISDNIVTWVDATGATV